LVKALGGLEEGGRVLILKGFNRKKLPILFKKGLIYKGVVKR